MRNFRQRTEKMLATKRSLKTASKDGLYKSLKSYEKSLKTGDCRDLGLHMAELDMIKKELEKRGLNEASN